MRITADTNLLIRIFIEHDPEQSAVAQEVMRNAASIALTLTALCEFVWVLSRPYKRSNAAIASAIRAIVESENVEVDRLAVDAGLAMLDAGGDFADGVIAHQGRALGAETFVSFDREAVRLLQAQGEAAELLV